MDLIYYVTSRDVWNFMICTSSNIIAMMKPRRELRGEAKTSFWWGKMKESVHMYDLSVNGSAKKL